MLKFLDAVEPYLWGLGVLLAKLMIIFIAAGVIGGE